MDLLIVKRVYLAFFFLVAGVVLGAGACGFDPQIADGAFACAADRSCPNGFVCAGDNKCYRPGNGPPVPTIDGGGTDGPDSSPPLVISKLQADAISLAEGNSSVPTDFVFTVRLAPPSAREVTVDYATNDGTAKVNEDYAGAAGKLTFPPGSTSQTVTVKVIADRFEEPDEAFKLTLSNPVNAEFLPGAGPEIAATIKNDDSPGLAIDDVTILEGDTDTTAALTVSLSGTFTTDVTVGFATLALAAGGAVTPATEGDDFNTTSDTLTFTPGTKTLQVVVPIKGDLAHERVEAFLVKLSNPVGAPLVDDEATVTITDNDPIPTITVAPATSAEGDVGTTNMTFVVTLSAASSEIVKVNFATGGGTAGTSDYSATNGELTFPAGTITQNVSVPVNGDLADEPDETFNVTLSAPANATLGTAVAMGTITDDDAPPVLTVGDVSLAEGNVGTTTFSFPFTLSAPSGKNITISYATANGTATAGTDFANAAGNVTFAAGETSKMVDVTVTADAVAEPSESFTLTLTNPQNVTPPVNPPTGTIINDDGAAMTLSIDNVTIAEGLSGTKVATFTVSCAGTGNWSVSYSTSNGTAAGDSDYVAITPPVALPTVSCATTQTINVTVNGDNQFEADETFTVNLSNPSADVAIVDSQGLGTITNDDGPPTINIASASGTEGNVGSTVFGFDVTLTNPASTAVTVNYATSAGVTNPASAGSDYVTTSGTLTFAPGETTKTINVTVNGDAVYELDETFRVTLSANSGNSTLGTSVATGTITNDEPQPTVAISDATATEGNSGTKTFTFDVTLSGESSQTVTVDYASSDGTATAPSDYSAKTGTVTWTPGGNLTQTITITVVGDANFEPSETFNVGLSNPVNTTIADNTGVGTITNDDSARLISINDVTVTENNSNGFIRFTVTLSPTISSSTSVTWTLVHGSTSNADFAGGTAFTGTVTFPSNDGSESITLTLNNDSLDELDETFEIRLSNPTNGAQIGDDIGIGTITDNDASPSVSISGPGSVNEGDSGTKNFTFTVTLSAVSGREVTVQYATRDGSARSSNPNKDYDAQSGALIFAPGETSKQVNVVVRGDTDGESDETFFVDLSNPNGATISTGSAQATIKNDD